MDALCTCGHSAELHAETPDGSCAACGCDCPFVVVVGSAALAKCADESGALTTVPPGPVADTLRSIALRAISPRPEDLMASEDDLRYRHATWANKKSHTNQTLIARRDDRDEIAGYRSHGGERVACVSCALSRPEEFPLGSAWPILLRRLRHVPYWCDLCEESLTRDGTKKPETWDATADASEQKKLAPPVKALPAPPITIDVEAECLER